MKTQRRSTAVHSTWTLGVALGVWLAAASATRAQSYGVELHNTLMPVSGAMGGASLARPQDLLSAINGNPATLAAFDGTQFTFGGAWAEPTYNITQLNPLPLVGVDPYSARSGTPGAAAGNIGVTQELNALGLPATFGIGFFTNAGAGVDFRDVPASNGTSAQYLALDITPALGLQLTERMAVGGAFTLGTSFLDGPFTDAGGMTGAFGIRGTLGMSYALADQTSVGAYWQTKKHFHFEDAVLLNGQTFDIPLDHPENLGVGIADESLMDGRLLLAMDVLYKQYGEADFFRALYTNQWVYQFGAQYAVNSKLKLRCGYSYNENPMRGPAVTSIAGIPIPDGIPGFRYIQGQFAAIGQHHLTGGVGIADVLPGMDMDMLMGGMFNETDQFASTIASVESYWIGSYLTWRFGANAAK
jgi:long-chain fatty acid transport protein